MTTEKRNWHPHWGEPPWTIDFTPRKRPFPKSTDFAVIGAGFTGLAAAAWLRRLAPEKSVAVFEAARVGAGASGRTGGMVLAETAAGDLPGLGDVLAGFQKILRTLEIDCALELPGAWEIAREKGIPRSPIEWSDSGTLRVVDKVPGGTLDPGRLISGIARVAEAAGGQIFENCPADKIEWHETPVLHTAGGECAAGRVLLATNALALDLTQMISRTEPKLTLAVLTEPLRDSQLEQIGLASGHSFYTEDLPYLWGRRRSDRSVIFGGGLVDADDSHDLLRVDARKGRAQQLFESIERRVRGLHPALAGIRFTHRWGGPILFRSNWQPAFMRHPRSETALIVGAYAGHGVALSSYFGAWAAEVLLGRREPPQWGGFSK